MTVIQRLSRSQIRTLLRTETQAPISDANRDEMAIPSYLHPNPLIRWLMWRRYQVVAELAHLSRSDSVLEFGCGAGVFLPALAACAGEVRAIDLFPQYAQRLVETLNLPVAFIHSLDEVPEGSLDVVVAADVLEHLDDPGATVSRFFELLKPGGRLLVSGPTENRLYQLGRMAAGFGGKGGYHRSNIDLLAPVIAGCGFRLVSARSLPFSIPPSLFRILLYERMPVRTL